MKSSSPVVEVNHNNLELVGTDTASYFTRKAPSLNPLPRLTDGRKRYILQFEYEFEAVGSVWKIPARFIYDGASIPTLIGLTWVITYSKFDPWVMRAALCHDFFCELKPEHPNSVEAANIFYQMLIYHILRDQQYTKNLHLQF